MNKRNQAGAGERLRRIGGVIDGSLVLVLSEQKPPSPYAPERGPTATRARESSLVGDELPE
ncbi:MAG TPA: hypothetical protein EYP14_13910 [Planctomycetaceae bacterium]|nr:hypothetical protein [Planctomycetaceae bacterium]